MSGPGLAPPTALVLAGGLGTRLAAHVPGTPKAMAPVAGRPFADWLVDALSREGVERIVFCTGHLHDEIERHFHARGRAGALPGVEILFSREDEPLGTGGALRLAASRQPADAERFFVVNGDSLCAFDLDRLARFHRERGARATLWTVPADDPSRYGSVLARPDGRVVAFLEKAAPETGPKTTTAAPAARVHAGISIVDRSVLESIPPGRPVSLERDVYPSLAGEDGALWSVAGDGPLLDIGTPESYRSAPGVLARIGAGGLVERRRFVLLDRDGTLIEERHYLSDPGGVVLTAGAGQALRRLVGRGLGLVVVTNQSAVGRGFFDFARLDAIHEALANRLADEGVALDGVFACPHRPEDDCACRKPRTALVERASAELAFDPAEAFVVGDKASDLELGRRLGARTILVRTGYGRETEAAGGSPDHVADDLRGAADFIEAVLDHDTRETRGTRATETQGTTKAADAGDLAEVRREKR